MQANKEKTWDIFQWYFRIQIGLQIFTDVAAVYVGTKNLACENKNKITGPQCDETDKILTIILGF